MGRLIVSTHMTVDAVMDQPEGCIPLSGAMACDRSSPEPGMDPVRLRLIGVTTFSAGVVRLSYEPQRDSTAT
jgi:hypothetical protein